MKKILLKMFPFFLFLFASFPHNGYAISGDDAVKAFQGRMYSIGTMEGTLNITYASGMTQTGQFKFMAPGKFLIKFSNPSGKVICSNGKKLWVYDPATALCGVQELSPGSLSGGIAGMLAGYMAIATQSGSDYVIKLRGSGKAYSEIVILADKTFMLKRAEFKSDKGNAMLVVLSNVRVNVGLHSGLFDYSAPSNAQVVKDPLNIK